LKSVPEPGNLASYLPLNAAPDISQFVRQTSSNHLKNLNFKWKEEAKEIQGYSRCPTSRVPFVIL